jgi:hypothetical protein
MGDVSADGPAIEEVPGDANASNTSDATRHRPPTRRAGSRPVAIQRWTERVVAPIRVAAWLGLSSSVIAGAIVACKSPGRQVFTRVHSSRR